MCPPLLKVPAMSVRLRLDSFAVPRAELLIGHRYPVRRWEEAHRGYVLEHAELEDAQAANEHAQGVLGAPWVQVMLPQEAAIPGFAPGRVAVVLDHDGVVVSVHLG